MYRIGINGVCENLVFWRGLALAYKPGRWFNSLHFSVSALSPCLCVGSPRPEHSTFFSVLCIFKWMHKNISLDKYLSHSSLYSVFGVPRRIQGLAAVTGLTTILVCLPPPEGDRVMFDPGWDGSPVFPRCPCLSQQLGFKWCMGILSTPVGLIN